MYDPNSTGSVAEPGAALKHFQEMLAINPGMEEARLARQNIAAIQTALGGQ